MNYQLDPEERELLAAYDNGECESILTPDDLVRYQTMARNTRVENQRVDLQISQQDFALIQAQALAQGVPYQTLMSSVLHDFVNGGLKRVARPPLST